MTDLPPPPPPNISPPPGYVPYGGFGAVQGRFDKVRGLTKWLVVLLGITLVIQAASVLVQLSLRSSAKDFLNNDISSADFDDKLALFFGIALVALGITIAQAVILIIWTFRMAKNHIVLGRQPQTFSPGATVAVNILGGCTLGIINFFMWREMWKASDPDTAPGDPSWKQRAVSPLVTAYLVLSLGGAAAGLTLGFNGGFGGFRTGGSADDIAENLEDKLAYVALSGFLTLAAAVVFIIFVRHLAARHMQATREA